MQIQESALADRVPVDQSLLNRQTDDTAEPAWLLFSRLTQEPIVWPRIFPGL